MIFFHSKYFFTLPIQPVFLKETLELNKADNTENPESH